MRDAIVGRRDVARLGLAALLFLAAPTVGDIGSCGQEVAELDPPLFFAQKRTIDCESCTSCGLMTQACQHACDPAAASEPEFPPGCYPLVHDGEVCLRALRAADCDAYARYVDDAAPEAPTECNFCPPDRRPGGA
ncbi:MAG: hypothetical protein HY744_10835 [Deltaproteobacteria bacterium]|nr:hypothetical protein [Deltaproteobacteria bacterium]